MSMTIALGKASNKVLRTLKGFKYADAGKAKIVQELEDKQDTSEKLSQTHKRAVERPGNKT